MSAKSTKPAKKLSTPRELSEIHKEYQHKCAEAGMLQYQVAVQSEELGKVNEYLRKLNYEAAARNKLDMEAKAANLAKAEVLPKEEASNEA